MPANPEKGPVFSFWSHIAEVLVYRAGGVLKKTDPELLVLHSIVSHQYQLILRHWCKTNLLFSYVVVISLYMKPYQHNRKMSAWNYVQMQLFILILNWFHALHFICCIIIFSFVSQWGFFFYCFVHLTVFGVEYDCSLVLFFSTACTLLAVLPSSVRLLTKPTFWQFKLALVSAIQNDSKSNQPIFPERKIRSVF